MKKFPFTEEELKLFKDIYALKQDNLTRVVDLVQDICNDAHNRFGASRTEGMPIGLIFGTDLPTYFFDIKAIMDGLKQIVLMKDCPNIMVQLVFSLACTVDDFWTVTTKRKR